MGGEIGGERRRKGECDRDGMRERKERSDRRRKRKDQEMGKGEEGAEWKKEDDDADRKSVV